MAKLHQTIRNTLQPKAHQNRTAPHTPKPPRTNQVTHLEQLQQTAVNSLIQFVDHHLTPNTPETLRRSAAAAVDAQAKYSTAVASETDPPAPKVKPHG